LDWDISNWSQLEKDAVLFLSDAVSADDAWNLFGFNRRPKRGSAFDKFISNSRLNYEQFVRRELAITALVPLDLALDSVRPAEREQIMSGFLARCAVDTLWLKAFGFDEDYEFCRCFKGAVDQYREAAPAIGSTLVSRGTPHTPRDRVAALYHAGVVLELGISAATTNWAKAIRDGKYGLATAQLEDSASTTGERPPERFCPFCSGRVFTSWRFCSHCARELNLSS